MGALCLLCENSRKNLGTTTKTYRYHLENDGDNQILS